MLSISGAKAEVKNTEKRYILKIFNLSKSLLRKLVSFGHLLRIVGLIEEQRTFHMPI